MELSSAVVSCTCQRRVLGTLVCLLLLVGRPGSLYAQSAGVGHDVLAPPRDAKAWVPSFRTMGQDALDILRAPTQLSRSEQFLVLGTTGVVFSAVAALDRPVYQRLHVRSGVAADVTRPLAAPGRWYDRVGPDRVALGAAGLLATGGLVLRKPKWTRTSMRLFEAVLYTKLVTGFAKGLFSRTRPFVGAGPFKSDFGEFDGEHTSTSMPSGHTARAFAIASVLAHEFDSESLSILLYSGAASVGLERMRSGDHWMTDVAVGAAIGYFIGQSVTSSSSSSDDVRYTPILSTDRVGLTVRF